MKAHYKHLILAFIAMLVVLPVAAAILGSTLGLTTDRPDAARIVAVSQQHPNFSIQQRAAIFQEIQSELHPLWKNLSVAARVARVSQFALHMLKPQAAAASAGTQSSADFSGNLTVITAPAGEAFGLQRQSNCSLSMYTGNLTLGNNPSNQILASTADYEQILHNTAGLTTRADVFSKGCVEPTLGIGSRRMVYLGKTTQNESLFASFGFNSILGNNALYYGTANTNSMAVSNFSSDASLPGIRAVAAGDLNGDGMADIIGLDRNSASISVWLAHTNGTISTATAYALPGSATEAAAVADVNGDGKADVIVATRNSSGQETISVLTGKGDGTLNPAQSFQVPTPAASMGGSSTQIANLIAANLRGGGKLDIVATNGLVLLNNGSGTFTVGTSAFPPVTATSVYGPNLAAGDFNNDGKSDLAVSSGAAISIYLGNGDGTFTGGNSYASIDDVGYVTATDLDGDGNADLYVGLANGGIFVGDEYGSGQAYALMGNGDGTFHGAASLPFVYKGNNFVDLDGDQVLDGIGVNADASFTTYRGDGKGGFSTAGTLSTSPITIGGQQFTVSGIDSYAVGDINADGKPDLVYIASSFNGPGSTPGVFVALGNGQGGFAAPAFYSVPSTLASGDFDIDWSISNVKVADVNNDHKADLIYSYNDTSSRNNTVNFGTVVQLGNGDGTYQAPLVIPYRSEAFSNGFNPTETAYVQLVTDLNHDGFPDLVFIAQSTTLDHTLATYVSSIQVALGRGDGTFATPTAVAGPTIMVQSFTDVVPASIAVADMNGDGIPDIVALGSSSTYATQLAVALGNGDGSFKAPVMTTYTTQYLNNLQGIAIADFNGDGKLDVAMTDPYSSVGSGISFGNGDGTAQTSTLNGSILPNAAINLIVGGAGFSGDFNGDGKPDLLAGNVLLLSQAASVVGTAASSTTLMTSATTITAGQSLALSATVAATSGSTVPTGSVTFLDGSTVLGTASLDNTGTATFASTTLAAGSHSLSASYSGSTTFAASTSSAVEVTVSAAAPDFTMALSPATGSAVRGQSTATALTLTPTNGFNQSVALTCSGLPTGATCSFSPASVSVNGSAATSTLTIATTASTAMNWKGEPLDPAGPGGVLFAIFGLPAVVVRRRLSAQRRRYGIFAICLAGILSLQACSHGDSSNSGSTGATPVGTYTVTISATAGSTTHTTAFTLTVS